MKTIICGGRTDHITPDDKKYLAELKETLPITKVISGGATGVDTDAVQWAKDNNIEYEVFYADWNDLSNDDAIIVKRSDGTQYDARAGFRRNVAMAEVADVCIAFKGGNGTKHMINLSKKMGLRVFSNGTEI
jgi:predicted Rossmann-fold nucleotide-binding protein